MRRARPTAARCARREGIVLALEEGIGDVPEAQEREQRHGGQDDEQLGRQQRGASRVVAVEQRDAGAWGVWNADPSEKSNAS
jgi:hypothetical protein